MLTLGIINNIFTHGLNGLFLMLDSIVFWVVSLLYQLFYDLASFKGFMSNTVYEEIANRFLVVIGVAMLFYLSYSLLKALVNPDELNKTTSKIVTNLVISLVLITVIPTIFMYAFKIQNIIMEDNVIDTLVFGKTSNSLTKVGRATAMTFFETFAEIPDNVEIGHKKYTTWGDLKEAIVENKKGVGFLDVTYVINALEDYPDQTSYVPILGALCGIFLIYVIFSFCLDMGLRVVKLAFYQIISPIPIMMRIIPNKKSVFDNWVKATLATYLEVFIRIFIMYLIAFLVANIINNILNFEDLGLFGIIIVLMGIFAFAKQAPKLIGDMIGIKSGNFKLGIRQKIADGGGYVAAAAIGAGATAFARNAHNFYDNLHGAKNFKDVAKTTTRGIGSMTAGAFSGLARGGYDARKANNLKDVKNAAIQGAEAVVQSRINKETYRANHGDSFIGSVKGHINDMKGNIKSLVTGSATGIMGKVKFEENFKNSYKDYEAIYETPNYKAMKAQLERYEALKASGVTTYEGQNVVDAIDELKGSMLKSRMESIRKNEQSAAYAMYNITRLAKQNREYAKSVGINVSGAENLELKGNQIIDKTTGSAVTANQLYEIIEGSSLKGITYSSADGRYVDSSGSYVDFESVAKTQAFDGMSHQKFTASKALRRDQMSVEYKEALRQQESQKK